MHWAVYLLFLCWALAGSTVQCWSYGPRAGSPLRAELLLVGGGCALGLGYLSLKATTLALQAAGVSLPSTLSAPPRSAVDAILATAVLLTAAGVGGPVLLRHTRALRRSIARHDDRCGGFTHYGGSSLTRSRTWP